MYIDAFAGTGQISVLNDEDNENVRSFINGSARVSNSTDFLGGWLYSRKPTRERNFCLSNPS